MLILSLRLSWLPQPTHYVGMDAEDTVVVEADKVVDEVNREVTEWVATVVDMEQSPPAFPSP